MSQEDTDVPPHHWPQVQGMHQTTPIDAVDPWEAFFSACWDGWALMQQRLAARQSKATIALSEQSESEKKRLETT